MAADSSTSARLALVLTPVCGDAKPCFNISLALILQARAIGVGVATAAVSIFGEARERGIQVSRREVDRELARSRRAAFPTERAFKRFLRQTGQTIADLRFRTRIDLVTKKLQAVIDPGEFASKWRARTLCAPGFTVPECGGTLTS